MQEISEHTSDFVMIEGRKSVSVGGVTDVVEFDENAIVLNTEGGELIIEGSELKISVLDMEKKQLEAKGKIDSAIYSDGNTQKKKGLFSKFSK